jgi:hypothetical protein
VTPAELERAGRAIYGERWHAALARALGIADRTVRRWRVGEQPIPEPAAAAIAALVDNARHRTPMPQRRSSTVRLWHYTANSGHVAETGRDAVDQDVIDRLLPIVDMQQGDLPELGLGIDVMSPLDPQWRRLPGAAFFQIAPVGERMSKAPYVMAVACWRADREADAWAQFLGIAGICAEFWPRRPAVLDEPPDIPWLAVHLLPRIAELPPALLPVIGDLERCLAWALIESE